MRKLIPILFMMFLGIEANAQSWLSLTDLPVAFSFPVVVELNGEIHVIGGGGPSGATDLHIRYKPSTNKWDTLAPIPYKAQQPAGAVVKGKIHFCGGGFPNTGTRLDKHYYYDPDSNKWFKAANMPAPTAIHKAVAMDDKLYVLSGQPDKQLCEYYDPVTDTWTKKNILPDIYFWYGAIVAGSGTIFRFGGGGFTGPQKAAHQYDKASDSWIPLKDLPIALHGVNGALVQSSFICLSGGYNGGDKSEVIAYGINTGEYNALPPLPSPRTYHNMVSIGGCLYSIGGNNNVNAAVSVSLLKYCPTHSLSTDALNTDQSLPYQLVKNNEKIMLMFQNHEGTQPIDISITDIAGKTVFTGTTNSNVFEFNSSYLNSSVYLVNIKCDGNYYIEKWVVVK